MMTREITRIDLFWNTGLDGTILIVEGKVDEELAERIASEVRDKEGYSVDDFIKELEKHGYKVIATINYNHCIDIESDLEIEF